MSDEILTNCFWYDVDGMWELCRHDQNQVLARLRKDRGVWYGRCSPKTTDHLAPQKSLSQAMKQAELYLKMRQ